MTYLQGQAAFCQNDTINFYKYTLMDDCLTFLSCQTINNINITNKIRTGV